MIILCDEEQYEKKRLKKVHKIIISNDLEDVPETRTISHMHYLIPQSKLMNKYYADEISAKKYKKKYFEYLEENQIYATLLTLMLIYKETKQLVIVCSRMEREFLYIQFLLEYLHEKFGVPVIKYEDWKKKEFVDKFNINKDVLKKEVKKYRHILFEDEIAEEEEKKKSKKKSKDKSKKKDSKDEYLDLPEMDIKDHIKKIKLKRIKEVNM